MEHKAGPNYISQFLNYVSPIGIISSGSSQLLCFMFRYYLVSSPPSLGLGSYDTQVSLYNTYLIFEVLQYPTPKEGGLLSKVLPKHEHNIQVDPLASISMGATQFKNQEIQLGPSLCYMKCSLQSQEYVSDPTFSMWEGTLLTLVHSVLSQSPFLKCL